MRVCVCVTLCLLLRVGSAPHANKKSDHVNATLVCRIINAAHPSYSLTHPHCTHTHGHAHTRVLIHTRTRTHVHRERAPTHRGALPTPSHPRCCGCVLLRVILMVGVEVRLSESGCGGERRRRVAAFIRRTWRGPVPLCIIYTE